MNDQLESSENAPVEISESAAESTLPTESNGSPQGSSPEVKSDVSAAPATPKSRSPKTRKGGRRPAHAQRAAHPPQVVHHYEQLADEEDGFWAKHRGKIIAAVVLLLAGGAAFFLNSGKSSAPAAKTSERVVSISLPPLPPPPPPPPPPKHELPPPKADEKMDKAPEDDKPPDAPKAAEPPKEALGTNNKGPGPGLSGLGGSGAGGGLGFGGGGGGGGTKLGYFTGQLKKKVVEALRTNKQTRTATLSVQVRIWVDSTGRVTRAQFDGKGTDNAGLNDVIQNQILSNLQLDQPPPPNTKMPIVMRLTASRK